MKRPTTAQVVIGIVYTAVVAFTFYSLIITDKDYAHPLIVVCAIGGVALLIPLFRQKPVMVAAIVTAAIALAWGLARFYFDEAR